MNDKKDKKIKINRRGFIQSSLAAFAGLGLTESGRLLGEHASPFSQESPLEKPRIKDFRTLGRTGFKASDIGFGAGNLTNPEILEAALDMGVNYIDTGEHYTRGNSERAVGQVIKNRNRKSLFITTKLNFSLGKMDKEGLKQRFFKCLERLQTDYADCLMIHMSPTVEQLKHEDYHQAIRELSAEGKVKYTGLSNHGTEHRLAGNTIDDMEKVVLAAAEDGRFDVVLFVYNFIQKEKGERILKVLKDKKMGATLMKVNPVRVYLRREEFLNRAKEAGRDIPEIIWDWLEENKRHVERAEDFKKKYGLTSNREIDDAAIKFALSHPDVHSVCPTIDTFEELESYIALSGKKLESTERDMLADYESVYGRYYCRHACGQCEPYCPHSVPVNTIMRYHHYFSAQRREKYAMEKYNSLSRTNAMVCSSCAGYCESACPYSVQIQGLLILAHQTLTL
ncbi:MAG: aldo/keto reductase [Candidatus Aminicenantes bacterium]|nr:MAG: aldo/keto reductase [Candidatus Aminicenantes bacterium]